VKVDIELARKIADLCSLAQQYRYALFFYKVINDTAKIEECYRQIFALEPGAAYEMRMEFAEYLVTIILFDKAIEQFKLASDRTDDLTLKY